MTIDRTKWFTDELTATDREQALFYIDEPPGKTAALWRAVDGLHMYMGEVEFEGSYVYWKPEPNVRYIDVPKALVHYEDRREKVSQKGLDTN